MAPSQQKVTIADVARHAGVGLGTVSRVLNHSPRVSASTRARVEASMATLDYRPSPLAQGLSRGRTHSLGVVVPFFTHASAVERLRGVVAALRGSRYDLVLFNVESPEHRDEHFAALRGRDRADGLLVLSMPPPADDLARLRDAGVPVVLVDARAEHVPMVITDDVEGGELATGHLLELGHRRIAFMGDDPLNGFGFTSSAQRETGFRARLAGQGINVSPDDVVYAPHDREVAREQAAGLLRRPDRPTAVFASSDVQALGVMDAAAELGLEIPRDLSVVGFDDIEVAAYAGLTTVRQPLFDSGFVGARLLLDALDAPEPPGAETHRLSLELISRGSTATPLDHGGLP